MFFGDQPTYGQSASNSTESHGQASNSSSTFFVFPEPVSNNLFATSSTSYVQGRSQAPSSMRSIFSASPALGSSASSASTASFSACGTPLFSSAFGQSSSNSTESHGQASNFNSTSFVFPGSVSSTNPFSTSSTSYVQGGSQAPSSMQSILSASPALGGSALSTSAASFSAFGTTLFSSGSSFFNNNVGSLFQQTQSSSANQISGSSTVSGPSSQSTFGNNGALFSIMHNSVTPLSGFTGSIISSPSAPPFTTFKFGKSDGHESLNSQSIFGQPNSLIGTNRELGTRSFSSGFYPSATKSQCRGSGVASYVATPEVNDIATAQTCSKIVSISAMSTYKDKSHEELRLEDYQLSREKGSSVFNKNPGSLFQQTPSTSANHISVSSTEFGPLSQSTFVNSNALVSGEGNSVPHCCKCSESSGSSLTLSFPFVSPGFSSHGPSNMTSMVSNKELGPSPVQCHWQGSRVSPYAATPEVWNNVNTPTSAKIISISAMPVYKHKSHEELKFEDYLLTRGKGCCVAKNQSEASSSKSATRNLSSGTTCGFNIGMNNIISPKLQFSELSVGIANSLSESTLTQNQQDMLRETSTGLGLQLPYLLLYAVSGNAPVFKTQPAFTSNAAPISISNQPSADPTAWAGSQNINIQQSAAENNLTIGWSPVTNPFSGEPGIKISVDCPVSSTTIQDGISSLSVNDNPSTIRRRSLLTVRHLSLQRNRPTVEKYKPERDHKKVPFFEEGLPDSCKFEAPFIPRGNPRAWLLRPTEEQSTETKTSKSCELEDKSTGIQDTGISNEASKEKDGGSSKFNLSLNGSQEGKMHIISQGHQPDEDANIYAHAPDVQRIMPKIQCPEYYTIPPINELAAKEKTEPGFCHHVKDFVVGRYGYGSIKFFGETDVTNLDLESLIQINYREVILYMAENKKPPVGQGLNKPAEITLLNVKCFDKNTGRQQVDGPMVDKYRQMLVKKGAEQGAEFVSYDPASGEWKLRIQHF